MLLLWGVDYGGGPSVQWRVVGFWAWRFDLNVAMEMLAEE